MSEEQLNLLEKYTQKLNTTLIPSIIEKVSAPNKEIVKKNLESSLKKKYRDVLLYMVKERDELLFDSVLKDIISDWTILSEEKIMEDSIYDASLLQIVKASEEAKNLALQKITKEITCTDKDTYDRLISIWESQQDSVETWNKEVSALEISEGYLDLNYAFGFSECVSLRLAKYLGGKK